MKLCIDCKHYGGIKASNGKYICDNVLNSFKHPVDGLDQKYDCNLGAGRRGALRLGGQVVDGGVKERIWDLALVSQILAGEA